MMNKQEIEKILKKAHTYAENGAIFGRTKDDKEHYAVAKVIFECLIDAMDEMKYGGGF